MLSTGLLFFILISTEPFCRTQYRSAQLLHNPVLHLKKHWVQLWRNLVSDKVVRSMEAVPQIVLLLLQQLDGRLLLCCWRLWRRWLQVWTWEWVLQVWNCMHFSLLSLFPLILLSWNIVKCAKGDAIHPCRPGAGVAHHHQHQGRGGPVLQGESRGGVRGNRSKSRFDASNTQLEAKVG